MTGAIIIIIIGYKGLCLVLLSDKEARILQTTDG
jgi:hypothetical protein